MFQRIISWSPRAISEDVGGLTCFGLWIKKLATSEPPATSGERLLVLPGIPVYSSRCLLLCLPHVLPGRNSTSGERPTTARLT